MSACDSITVGCLESTTWVQVDGRAGQGNCGNVKKFLRDRFDEGLRNFVIDLENCSGIDSTFIGMLYRLAVDVEQTGEQGGVHVVDACERNAKSITKLGLDSKIQLHAEASEWSELKERISSVLLPAAGDSALEKTERADMIIECHEALAEANSENRKRFNPLLSLLRKEQDEEETE